MMHENIEELLDISAGEQSLKRKHVAECEQCQSALDELQSFESRVALEMFDAADKVPSDDVWDRIQKRLYQPPEHIALVAGQQHDANNVRTLVAGANNSLTKAIYALAASIAFVGVIAVFMFSQQQSNQLQAQVIQSSIDELMLSSRGLEHVLQKMANQNEALSVANQTAADRLHWRLTYVDQLIDKASPENVERMEVLWNDRVDALNELNQLYYQRGIALNTPEF